MASLQYAPSLEIVKVTSTCSAGLFRKFFEPGRGGAGRMQGAKFMEDGGWRMGCGLAKVVAHRLAESF